MRRTTVMTKSSYELTVASGRFLLNKAKHFKYFHLNELTDANKMARLQHVGCHSDNQIY